MKTLSVTISENEYKKYGLKKDQLTFAEMVKMVNRLQFKNNLKKSVELASEYGLSAMTMEEIDEEINAARRDAKGRH